MKERQIGVTGSHGFVGEHLCSSLDNCERLGRTGFMPKLHGVIDLATYGNIWNQKDRIKTYEANLMRIVGSSANFPRTDWLMFVSTSSVTLPQQTYYSASKKAAEEFLQIYSEQNDYPVAIVRPYSVIGPGEQEEHLIPKLIHSCTTGEEMPFVGEPVHDFIDVRDFVDALLTIKDNIRQCRGDIFHVGSSIQHTNEEVKDIVETITGKETNLKRLDSMRSYDTDSWVADTTDIKNLGWEPKYTLEQTISDMVIDHIRK